MWRPPALGAAAPPVELPLHAAQALGFGVAGCHLHAHGQLRPADLPATEIVSYLEADGRPRFSEQRFLLS